MAKIKLTEYPKFSPFEQIRNDFNQPLQVMVDSTETKLIKYLIDNGFECKRHCYCPEFTIQDLKNPLQDKYLLHPFDNKDPLYFKLCNILYHHYKEISEPISALTANYQTFIKEIPTTTGYYALDQNDKIKHVIFTEKNEIAYVCSSDKSSCSLFCEAVLKQIFAKYRTTFFEADAETDWPAMTLLHLFNYDYKESFNTYIYS